MLVMMIIIIMVYTSKEPLVRLCCFRLTKRLNGFDLKIGNLHAEIYFKSFLQYRIFTPRVQIHVFPNVLAPAIFFTKFVYIDSTYILQVSPDSSEP